MPRGEDVEQPVDLQRKVDTRKASAALASVAKRNAIVLPGGCGAQCARKGVTELDLYDGSRLYDRN